MYVYRYVYLKPYSIKNWDIDILHINWCRISSIKSTTKPFFLEAVGPCKHFSGQRLDLASSNLSTLLAGKPTLVHWIEIPYQWWIVQLAMYRMANIYASLYLCGCVELNIYVFLFVGFLFRCVYFWLICEFFFKLLPHIPTYHMFFRFHQVQVHLEIYGLGTCPSNLQ